MWLSFSLSQLIAFIGLAFVGLFGFLSKTRHEPLSLQFALEGMVLTALAVALVKMGYLVNPILFFSVLYLVTMRGRWLTDVGNFLASRRRYRDSLIAFDLAVALRPDALSRAITEMNRAWVFFRLGHVERARRILEQLLAEKERVGLSPKHVAAIHYNLGIIARREGQEDVARRHFEAALEAAPHTIYAYGAQQALTHSSSHSEEDRMTPSP